MNVKIDSKQTVGIVSTEKKQLELPGDGFKLRRGGVLSEIVVAYEAYGTLSPEQDNVVHICHALTGDAHAAGYHSADDGRSGSVEELCRGKPGWWEDSVGPGKGIDTDYYYVICSNIIGGCAGTTGPSSIDPSTGKPYGSAFPQITVTDIVAVQKLLLEQLGINRLAAVIGGSFGGMQVLEWSIRYPEAVDRCIAIACGASLSSQALAFDVVARNAIVSDPEWHGGDYYGTSKRNPVWGLSHARKIGHITYLSPEIMQKKFGRSRATDKEGIPDDRFRFQVESYLDHQGNKLVDRFDANSYLHITEAMDDYDLVDEFGGLKEAFTDVKARFLVIALSSDWLFPPEQSVELADGLLESGKRVSYCKLKAPYGHDAFLLDIENLADTIRAFLPWVSPFRKGMPSPKKTVSAETVEHRLIVNAVGSEARVLDLGCGTGDLMTILKDTRQIRSFGVDIDLDNVIQAIDKGHDVFQGDLDDGLSVIPDNSYDYAVLSSTLQVVKRPRFVLLEMLRVAKEGILTFPNFGNWHNRLILGLRGRMPKSSVLPFEWYDTPNIHLTTIKDFLGVCRDENISVLEMRCIPVHWLDKLLVRMGLCNLGAQRVLVRIARKTGKSGSASCGKCSGIGS
jgi:homoserine O-acetyltransferase